MLILVQPLEISHLGSTTFWAYTQQIQGASLEMLYLDRNELLKSTVVEKHQLTLLWIMTFSTNLHALSQPLKKLVQRLLCGLSAAQNNTRTPKVSSFVGLASAFPRLVDRKTSIQP